MSCDTENLSRLWVAPLVYRYLSNTASSLVYVLFTVSRITLICQIIRKIEENMC